MSFRPLYATLKLLLIETCGLFINLLYTSYQREVLVDEGSEYITLILVLKIVINWAIIIDISFEC